ncbi:hypothetical protein FSARC_9514 [Fusarium sarcochroum]|uniref:Peroxin 11C n=1 Tax=Fusarium sarcochroum TaxID=1208366 RepID=A0A8H4X5R3_9HYPO|nr:hypothetical protein FSARC_9514 [Fusarium sarcochroum]
MLTLSSIETPISSVIASAEEPQEAHIFESKPPLPDQHPLSNKVPTPVKKLDNFVSRLNRLLHTRENNDSLIIFLCYATHFVATVLETPSPRRLRIWAVKLSKLLSRIIPPKALSILSTSKLLPLLSALPTYKLFLAERIRALADILDDWQIITRLWGLLATWTDAKEFIVSSTDPKEESKDGGTSPRDYLVTKAIRATYVLGLIGYYSLENTAWLTRRGVFKWSEKTESRLMNWSIRSWGVYVLAEMAQLLYDRIQRQRKGEDEDEDSRTEWNRKFVQTLAWAPLSIHWTKAGGLFPEALAAFLAAYSEFITVRGLWKETV